MVFVICIYSGHVWLHVARLPRLLQQLHVLPLLLHVLPASRLLQLEIPLLVRLMAQQPRAIQPRLQGRSAHGRTIRSRRASTKLSMSWLWCQLSCIVAFMHCSFQCVCALAVTTAKMHAPSIHVLMVCTCTCACIFAALRRSPASLQLRHEDLG